MNTTDCIGYAKESNGMESLSSESKAFDASQIFWILSNELGPLQKAIQYFVDELEQDE